MEALALDGLALYQLPADVGRHGAFQDQRERRTYDFTEEICRDALLKQDFAMPRDELNAALSEAVRTYLMQRTWELIDTWN